MSDRNLKRLLLGLAGALAVFVVCLIPVLFGEDTPTWAIWGTCVGGLAILSFWSALVIASLAARRSAERPSAGPLPPRARIRAANFVERRGHEAARRPAPVGTPLSEAVNEPDSTESDAARFFLAEPNPEVDLDMAYRDDARTPPSPSFRALGIRRAGRPPGLPLHELGPDDRLVMELLVAQAEDSEVIPLASESDGSNADWLRRVKGTNCKGRLCWICGRKHGPEIMHN
jgi:hypothetical protein